MLVLSGQEWRARWHKHTCSPEPEYRLGNTVRVPVGPPCGTTGTRAINLGAPNCIIGSTGERGRRARSVEARSNPLRLLSGRPVGAPYASADWGLRKWNTLNGLHTLSTVHTDPRVSSEIGSSSLPRLSLLLPLNELN